MKIGFTGTQVGMNEYQKFKVKEYIEFHKDEITEFHHGDCIGADNDFNSICLSFCIPIHIHPPLKRIKRAYCRPRLMDEMYPPDEYLKRNRNIVKSTDMLIATPSGSEVVRSGTWYTVRYAKKLGKYILIIYPDRTISEFNKYKRK